MLNNTIRSIGSFMRCYSQIRLQCPERALGEDPKRLRGKPNKRILSDSFASTRTNQDNTSEALPLPTEDRQEPLLFVSLIFVFVILTEKDLLGCWLSVLTP
jgi:hypothetical protein